MAVTDQIGDMLTRIRNAVSVGKKTVSFPASNLKREICKILVQKGFVDKFVIVKDSKQGIIKVLLNYKDGTSVITGLERVSKPGRRVYCGSDSIPAVLSGLGYSIISTSNGVKTNVESKKENIGGEVLCKVW